MSRRAFRPALKERAPSHELQFQEYEDFRDYLVRWPWEWKIDFPFPDGVDYFRADRYFNEWRLRLIHEERIRLGAFRVTQSKNKRIHMHALALGRNREGTRLVDCSTHKWKDRWPFKITAKIKLVDKRLGACRYLAKHLLGFLSDYPQIDYFDRTLLWQSMDADRDRLLDNAYGLEPEPDGPGIGNPEDLLDGELDDIE
jgi:hypothetical protein